MVPEALAGGRSRRSAIHPPHDKRAMRRDSPNRLVDKDAYDVYRLLVAIDTDKLAAGVARLLDDELAADASTRAMVYLRELFAAGPAALGAQLVARAEEGVGNPEVAAQASAALAADLLDAIRRQAQGKDERKGPPTPT
jgi:hypothetical protein